MARAPNTWATLVSSTSQLGRYTQPGTLARSARRSPGTTARSCSEGETWMVPDTSTSPWCARRTGSGHSAASQSTMPWAKPSEICCATSTGQGKSRPSAGRMAAKACGPPVEAAMANTGSPPRRAGVPAGTGDGACAGVAAPGSGRARMRVITDTPASSRTLATKAAASPEP